MIVNKYYKVIKVIKDSIDGPTPLYIENISGEDGVFYTGSTNSAYTKRNLMYKVDDGEWFEYPDDQTKIVVPNGSKIYLKGDNSVFYQADYYVLKLGKKSSYSSLISFNIGGYLTSLIQSTNFDEVDSIPDYAFFRLFYTQGTNSYLKSIQNLITDNIKTVGNSSFSYCFSDCTSIQTLPEGMFSNVASGGKETFNYCFKSCTSLTTLPEGMFANITNCGSSSFNYCFQGCTSLTTLPEGMFSKVTIVDGGSFGNCFSGCTSLTTLPEGMFANLTNCGTFSFNYCFQGCTSLTTLPEGMFANLTNCGTFSFQYCFQGCTSLTALPEGMFSKVTIVDGSSFLSCFSGCTSLTTLPSNLFANFTSVSSSSFKQCFQYCTSLLVGPNFKKITGSTSHDAFDNCFEGCSNLQLIYAPSMSSWTGSYFQDWVKGVYPTGKMYVKAGVVPPTGTSGLPEGWQLLNY